MSWNRSYTMTPLHRGHLTGWFEVGMFPSFRLYDAGRGKGFRDNLSVVPEIYLLKCSGGYQERIAE